MRRITWSANQLIARARAAHDVGEIVEDGVLVTDEDLAELAGHDIDDEHDRQLPAEWDFPENRAWVICGPAARW